MQHLLLPLVGGGVTGASSARTGDSHIDGVLLAWLLAVVFVPPMFVLFCFGAGELFDWFSIRGWRPKDKQRPLK